VTKSRHGGSAAEFILGEGSDSGEVSEVHRASHERTRPSKVVRATLRRAEWFLASA
jgi:hypothetical protein